MSENVEEKQTRKEALKKLRESRGRTIEDATRNMKEQRKAFDAVRLRLKEGASTIPELAEATGMSPSRTLWIVASLKKYGEIVETEKDGGYFRYELSSPPPRDR